MREQDEVEIQHREVVVFENRQVLAEEVVVVQVLAEAPDLADTAEVVQVLETHEADLVEAEASVVAVEVRAVGDLVVVTEVAVDAAEVLVSTSTHLVSSTRQ